MDPHVRRRFVDGYRRLKSPVRPFVRRNWRNPAVAGSARLARRWLAIYENGTHDLSVNGEAEIIRRLPGRPTTVLDVGGFEGEWTSMVLSVHPQARVHVFEPAPPAADGLAARFGTDPRVSIHRFALGPAADTATLHLHPDHASMNSLVDTGVDAGGVEVGVRRGDDVLADLDLDRVDVLKVDAEGYDLQVLRGFSGALEDRRIAVVQFEYNDWNVRSRTLLADFYDFLEPLGYRLGKVHPDGVDFRSYGLDLENWVGPACVAVPGDRADLLDALGPTGHSRTGPS